MAKTKDRKPLVHAKTKDKKKKTVSDFFKNIQLSNTKSKEILPLLQILRQLSPDFRIIILSHIDNHTRDLLKQVLRNVLLDKSEMELIYQEDVKDGLQMHVEDVCSVLNTSSFEKKCNKDCLLKIGGSAFKPVLDYAIPLLLRLTK